MDKTFIYFAEKNGINIKEMSAQSKRLYDKPFKFKNRYMVCGYELKDEEIYYFAKGDPDVILRMCNNYIMKSGTVKKVDSD